MGNKRHVDSAFELAWDSLDLRSQAYLKSRLDGKKYFEVGEEFNVDRTVAKSICKGALWEFELNCDDYIDEVQDYLKSMVYINFGAFCKRIHSFRGYAPLALIHIAGGTSLFTNLGPLDAEQIYVLNEARLEELYENTHKLAPISLKHMKSLRGQQKILFIPELIEKKGELVFDFEFGIIRTKSMVRDRTQIVLEDRGVGVTTDELSEILGMKKKALIAQLERDSRFTWQAHEKKWVLKAWGLEPQERISALEAVERVLDEHGPLTLTELIQKAQIISPKSKSRYLQVLESEKFGQIPDSKLWDLTTKGAVQWLLPEPKKKVQIRETDSNKLIFSVEVTHDMLRGSGFPVDRRVTWRAGLLQPTKSRVFKVSDSPITKLNLSRTPGNSSLSSIRPVLEILGLKKGCQIKILLDLTNDQAYLKPECDCHPNREKFSSTS